MSKPRTVTLRICMRCWSRSRMSGVRMISSALNGSPAGQPGGGFNRTLLRVHGGQRRRQMLCAPPSGPSAATTRAFTSRCAYCSRPNAITTKHDQHAARGSDPAVALRHCHACSLVTATVLSPITRASQYKSRGRHIARATEQCVPCRMSPMSGVGEGYRRRVGSCCEERPERDGARRPFAKQRDNCARTRPHSSSDEQTAFRAASTR